MVRLRLGRFAWELYYTRTKAAAPPREEVRRRMAVLCGHLGYITGLFEYVSTDMLWLRSFALSGCVLIVGYQMAQPKIQWLSAGWNSVFSLVNIYHIGLLLRQLPVLSEEEAGLLAALGDRLTARQFQSLLEAGEWRSYEDGEMLTQEGSCSSDREVCLVAAGVCEVRLGGLEVGRLGPGGVVGEVGALALCSGSKAAPPPPASATVVARGSVRCLSLPWAQLKAEAGLGEAGPGEALRSIVAAALAAKVVAMHEESRALQYGAVLEMACAAMERPDPSVVAALAAFRSRRGISDEEHIRISQGVARCVSRGHLLDPGFAASLTGPPERREQSSPLVEVRMAVKQHTA